MIRERSERARAPVQDKLMRRLRLRHIELVELLGTAGSLRVAAEQMNLSQPAVSKMLREIEAVFEVRLFERGKSGVVPTAAGDHAVRHCRVIHNEVRLVAEAVASAVAGRGALLRVGTFSATAAVPAAIVHLRKSHPLAEVRLREGPAAALVELLLQNEIDCVVGSMPTGSISQEILDRLTARPFATDRLCIVAARSHKLARRRRIAWPDLADSQWILPPFSALLRQAFVGACLQQQLAPPSPAVETVSALTLQRLVLMDPGLLGVTRVEQLRAELSPEVVELPVMPRVGLPPLSLLTRRGAGSASELLEPFYLSLRRSVPARLAV